MLGSTRKFNFICILIVILGISSSSYSQTQIKKPLPPKPDVPKKKSDVPEVPLVDAVITFDHDIFDFGDVPAGTKVTHAFPVENRGVDTLNIVAIKAG